MVSAFSLMRLRLDHLPQPLQLHQKLSTFSANFSSVPQAALTFMVGNELLELAIK